jgi:hypothetical protein
MPECPDYDAPTRPGAAFSNGFEHDHWDAQHCDHCEHDREFRLGTTDEGCPLLVLAMVGDPMVTPEAWVPDQPNKLGFFYRCTHFTEIKPLEEETYEPDTSRDEALARAVTRPKSLRWIRKPCVVGSVVRLFRICFLT